MLDKIHLIVILICTYMHICKHRNVKRTWFVVEEDEKLTEVKFREIYNPPPPPAPGTVRTPEEIEADIRRQEAALERLFLISIQWAYEQWT